jgi:hypothetical protein
MDFKTITEKFYQFEKDLNLFEQQIDGVYFWELVRWNIHRQILQEKGVYGQAHTKFDINSKYYKIINATRNFFYKNPFLASKADILFIGHPRRKLMEDGLWWDIYSDPVIESIKNKRKCLLLERPILNKHLCPTKTSNIRHLDIAYFSASMVKRTKLNKVCLLSKDKSIIREINVKLSEIFNTNLNLEYKILHKLRVKKNQTPVYKILLKKIKPKIVIFLVSYGNEIFIDACKKLSIPSVELQHGTSIGFYHLGYSFPIEFPKKIFPDYLFVFGDFWKYRTTYPIPAKNIFSVGYPFFEMETNKYKDEPKKNQVIFISQNTIGGRLSKFAVELKKNQDFNLDIVYKLHPGEYAIWAKEYPWLVDSGVRIIDNDSEPLYKLLAQSKLLVSVYSTVVYEGLGMGLKIFLVDFPGIEYMDELISSKAAVKISSLDEFIQNLKQTSQDYQVKPDNFFKPNALKNIGKALDEIINKQCH